MIGFKLDKVLVVMLAVYSLVLSTTINNPHHVDESTHAFVGMFIKDLTTDLIKNPTLSFTKIYDYAMSYLAYYPKISLHYPPLPQALFSLAYSLFGVSLQISRMVSIILSLLLAIVVYNFSQAVFKNRTAALLASAMTMTSTIIFNMSVLAMQEIAFVLFFTLTMFWLYLTRGKESLRGSLILGVLMAATVLTKWQAITILPVVFAYSVIERKLFKRTLLAFVVTALLLAPYYLVLWKTNLLLLPFTANLEADLLDPTFMQLEGWIYYIKALLTEQFFLPVGIIVFLSALFYLIKKNRDWKFFATWLLVIFVIMVILHNKDARYTINLIPALVIPASYTIYRLSQKLGNMNLFLFIMVGLLMTQGLLAYINLIRGFTDVEAVSKHITNNLEGNVLVNTGLGTESPFIFEIARNSNFSHQVFRPCTIEFLEESPDSLVEKFGIKYIIVDKNFQSFTEKQRQFMEFINKNSNFTLLGDYERFSILQNNNYENVDDNEICNYVCATRKFTCSKFKYPSDALK